MGLAPPRAAKAASERTRPWCEYAARMIGAVTGRNQPAHISLDTAVTTKTRQHPVTTTGGHRRRAPGTKAPGAVHLCLLTTEPTYQLAAARSSSSLLWPSETISQPA